MKRAFLKRGSKPLKSGMISKQRKKIQSSKQNTRTEKYKTLLKSMDQTCSRCQKDSCSVVDPHHPKGRMGDNLFYFIPMCRECHILIHTNKQKYAKFFQ